jgi:hypothetical protein
VLPGRRDWPPPEVTTCILERLTLDADGRFTGAGDTDVVRPVPTLRRTGVPAGCGDVGAVALGRAVPGWPTFEPAEVVDVRGARGGVAVLTMCVTGATVAVIVCVTGAVAALTRCVTGAAARVSVPVTGAVAVGSTRATAGAGAVDADLAALATGWVAVLGVAVLTVAVAVLTAEVAVLTVAVAVLTAEVAVLTAVVTGFGMVTGLTETGGETVVTAVDGACETAFRAAAVDAWALAGAAAVEIPEGI